MSTRRYPAKSMVGITNRRRARCAEALALRRQGKLLREIGEYFGVGVERARCMVDSGKRFEALRSSR